MAKDVVAVLGGTGLQGGGLVDALLHSGVFAVPVASRNPASEPARALEAGHGKLTIAGHNHELLDELRNYHRDEDFRIVKQRDHMVSALRYGVMMRRHGKPLPDCDGVGHGKLPYAHVGGIRHLITAERVPIALLG